ncbi:AAA domain-containing protein [Stackebrandtia albiflava]|uniref:AAA domain-containing protein n=1 Tax=Stackebrandtia albiflava TaxID=406432 RepID=A0A562V521_9ACTN|nr:AAA family ATPase [Stackebrandtia albiflava]TWJ12980.1 AAA domain-containing protein [Stackebrandtia albiflava]
MAHIDVETPAILIVTGMPGAGKSTVTRRIAAELPRAARLDGDQVNRLVVSGRVGPLGEPVDEAERQVELCNRNLCALAANFADAGFTALIDWVIPTREQLDLFVRLLAPRTVHFVMLAPGIAACRDRDMRRDPRERFRFDGYEALEAAMSRELGDVGWWFDTSALEPGETARRVIEEAGERARVGGREAGPRPAAVSDGAQGRQVTQSAVSLVTTDSSIHIPGSKIT